ncbi:MAG: tryptophan--tRNA ligase [bacterium]|nr:tryptophan--tRNA ligase [bacterium]
MKKRILTGLKPTGELTLGNYIGAISQMVELSNDENNEVYLFVADLHALTEYQDPSTLRERIKKFIAMYIACGMDPEKVSIYIQSDNEYIPMISWILECNTYYGEASRMIQFKEKSKGKENFTVGLLTYPILMAADILYCDADLVPVGIDQKQHVELARDIAERFNNKYGKTFKLPEPLISKEGIKIKDLKDPSKKMSKSEVNPNGVISLFDSPEIVSKKIMGATTDSENLVYYDEENKPGISNLLNIASVISKRSIDDIANEYKASGYGNFKKYVASLTSNMINDIQGKYNYIINSGKLEEILNKGKENSRKLAYEKMIEMKKKVGLN